MRDATFVQRDKLFELYKGEVKFSRPDANEHQISRPPLLLGHGIDEEIEVIVAESVGPYALVVPMLLVDKKHKLIIPKEFIVSRTVQSGPELMSQVLTEMGMSFRILPERNGVQFFCLHYPTLEITNSLGVRHTIRDLLVRFTVGEAGSIRDLLGGRVNFFSNELGKNYRHSHLMGGIDKGLTAFCSGGTSAFQEVLTKSAVCCTKREMETFMLNLNGYLQWESLEGTPYVSICKLTEKGILNSRELVDLQEDSLEDSKRIEWFLQTTLELLCEDRFEDLLQEVIPGFYLFNWAVMNSEVCLYDLEMAVCEKALLSTKPSLVYELHKHDAHAPDTGLIPYVEGKGYLVVNTPMEEETSTQRVLHPDIAYWASKFGITTLQPTVSSIVQDESEEAIYRIPPATWKYILTTINYLLIYEREKYERESHENLPFHS